MVAGMRGYGPRAITPHAGGRSGALCPRVDPQIDRVVGRGTKQASCGVMACGPSAGTGPAATIEAGRGRGALGPRRGVGWSGY